jgi:hypothetical protein
MSPGRSSGLPSAIEICHRPVEFSLRNSAAGQLVAKHLGLDVHPLVGGAITG